MLTNWIDAILAKTTPVRMIALCFIVALVASKLAAPSPNKPEGKYPPPDPFPPKAKTGDGEQKLQYSESPLNHQAWALMQKFYRSLFDHSPKAGFSKNERLFLTGLAHLGDIEEKKGDLLLDMDKNLSATNVNLENRNLNTSNLTANQSSKDFAIEEKKGDLVLGMNKNLSAMNANLENRKSNTSNLTENQPIKDFAVVSMLSFIGSAIYHYGEDALKWIAEKLEKNENQDLPNPDMKDPNHQINKKDSFFKSKIHYIGDKNLIIKQNLLGPESSALNQRADRHAGQILTQFGLGQFGTEEERTVMADYLLTIREDERQDIARQTQRLMGLAHGTLPQIRAIIEAIRALPASERSAVADMAVSMILPAATLADILEVIALCNRTPGSVRRLLAVEVPRLIPNGFNNDARVEVLRILAQIPSAEIPELIKLANSLLSKGSTPGERASIIRELSAVPVGQRATIVDFIADKTDKNEQGYTERLLIHIRAARLAIEGERVSKRFNRVMSSMDDLGVPEGERAALLGEALRVFSSDMNLHDLLAAIFDVQSVLRAEVITDSLSIFTPSMDGRGRIGLIQEIGKIPYHRREHLVENAAQLMTPDMRAEGRARVISFLADLTVIYRADLMEHLLRRLQRLQDAQSRLKEIARIHDAI